MGGLTRWGVNPSTYSFSKPRFHGGGYTSCFKSQEDRLISSLLYFMQITVCQFWNQHPIGHQVPSPIYTRMAVNLIQGCFLLDFTATTPRLLFFSIHVRLGLLTTWSLLTIVYGLVVDDGSQEDFDSGGLYARSWFSRVREVCTSQTCRRRISLTNYIPNRLHVQHWMWQYRLGYLLHPSVVKGSDMRIIDVGTGNA